MADMKKNALAELAEKIGCLGKLYYSAGVIQTDELTPRDYAVIDKAQRIIAELAKVSLYESIYCKGSFTADVNTVDVIVKCRAIAAEGATDGETREGATDIKKHENQDS